MYCFPLSHFPQDPLGGHGAGLGQLTFVLLSSITKLPFDVQT